MMSLQIFARLRNEPSSRFAASIRGMARIGKRGGYHPMTTVATLLARKQQLLERLQEDPGPNERDEIQRLLEQIESALDALERARPSDRSAQ
ncbi:MULTISPECIES: hypothetical protein [unclassified Bradyrhizobium]|uniref:hypothetical protein n=1 Tax=unclassified Bradyrhizobium TaxID=2631580 RepID=UPI0024474742|nr:MULTISPECIES: hypothetical protein [unclassified Bradyrhizobium]MDH2347654.1 hypothetical protein [Bradyrhizobium sp. SSUT77]MDH2351919.1 hypothetical protein [Bradyrhizobium sp. SSUT112]